MAKQYLQRNLTEERFQSNIGDPAVIRGEVPEQKYGVSEIDLSGTLGLIGDGLNTALKIQQKNEVNAKTAMQNQEQERKNTILTDYAMEDNKIAMAAMQGTMTASDAAIARMQLRQQFLQVDPSHITSTDLNKQADANFGADIGATLFKNQLERENEAQKRVEAENFNQDKQFMTDYYPELMSSTDPTTWSTFRKNQAVNEISLNTAFMNVQNEKALHPELYTTGAPATASSIELQKTADTDMKGKLDMAILEAQSTMIEDGIVSDVELNNFTSQLANWYSANYGVNYNQALASAKGYTNKLYGPAVRQYQAQVKANLAHYEDKEKLSNHMLNLLKNEVTTKQIFGASAADSAAPAQSIVMEGNLATLMKTIAQARPEAFQMFWNMDGASFKGILASSGVDVKSDHPVEQGKQTAAFINMSMDPDMMMKLAPEAVEKYQAMSEFINRRAQEVFMEMANMDDRTLAGFPSGKVFNAVMNDMNVPSKKEEDTAIATKTDAAISPVKKSNDALIGREAKRQLQKEANGTLTFNTPEDKEAVQETLKKTDFLDSLLTLLDIEQEQERKDWLRYDEGQNKFYAVYGPGASNWMSAPSMAKFRMQVDKLNKIANDPLKRYKMNGVEHDDGKDIVNELVDRLGIIRMPEETSLRAGETNIEVDEGATSAATRRIASGLGSLRNAAIDIYDAAVSSDTDLQAKSVSDVAKGLTDIVASPSEFVNKLAENVADAVTSFVLNPKGISMLNPKGIFGREPARRHQNVVSAMAKKYVERKQEELVNTLKEYTEEAVKNNQEVTGITDVVRGAVQKGLEVFEDENSKVIRKYINGDKGVSQEEAKAAFEVSDALINSIEERPTLFRRILASIIPSVAAAELPRDPYYETILADEEVEEPEEERRRDPFAEGMIGPEDE